LVSITSGCAVIRPWEAVLTGVIGGSLTVVSARMFDKLKIDDPVGAISIHGACGCWVGLKYLILCISVRVAA
jgi:Amt family ammonium transporter